jgi:hypothetical protein
MIRKDFKYKLIKNFLTKEEVDLCMYYLKIKLMDHKEPYTKCYDGSENVTGVSGINYSCFCDPVSEAILINKLPLMEKETGLELLPTYSFTRVYTYDNDLPIHVDREECEISVSVMFGSDGISWPLVVDNTAIEMKPGDGVIYLGCESEHWRSKFEGDYHAQCFLHYVDKNGLNKEFAYDKIRRQNSGVPLPILK